MSELAASRKKAREQRHHHHHGAGSTHHEDVFAKDKLETDKQAPLGSPRNHFVDNAHAQTQQEIPGGSTRNVSLKSKDPNHKDPRDANTNLHPSPHHQTHLTALPAPQQ